MSRSQAVVGLAGHVDHGKTALVRALTGRDGDRLPEEKKRGITIELGFVPWQVGDTTIGVVDAPGHDRFVHAMVAGAAGIDLVVLCVAADDGVMPQTREHLDVLSELDVRAGVVALTKCDVADDETLALAEDDVRSACAGTFLERARIVRTSARTGAGITELTDAVLAALEHAPRPETTGPPWLSIDRVFTKPGFGTIVTGTLVRGAIAEGDELELLGDDVRRVLVRGLAVHGEPVPRASASTRLAVNLRGIEASAVARGAVLTTPGWQTPTRSLVADVHVFSGRRRPGPRTDVVIHVGSAHVGARVAAAPAAGERGLVRITLAAPVATYAGQRLVLRRPELDRDRTLGGGVALDPHPGPARRRSPLVASPQLSTRVTELVAAGDGLEVAALTSRLPPGTDVRALVASRVAAGACVLARGTLWVPAQLARARTAALAALAAFHRAHPGVAGATAAELEGQARLPALVAGALASLAEAGEVVVHDGRFALASHDPAALFARVEAAFAARGLALEPDETLRDALALPPRLFRDAVAELVRKSALVRLATGLHVHGPALDPIVRKVREHLASGALSPGDFKALSGLSRKNAILVLEHLDRAGVTRRQGDLRVRA